MLLDVDKAGHLNQVQSWSCEDENSDHTLGTWRISIDTEWNRFLELANVDVRNWRVTMLGNLLFCDCSAERLVKMEARNEM